MEIRPNLNCRLCYFFNPVDDENFVEPTFHYYCALDESCIDGFYWERGECPCFLAPSDN